MLASTSSNVSGTFKSLYFDLEDLFFLFMAALWNRAGRYIFALWFLSFFFLFFVA